MLCFGVALLFYALYFVGNCNYREADGSYVSKPLNLPVSPLMASIDIMTAPFTALLALFGGNGLIGKETTAVWNTPEPALH